jgi:uncharacterized protein (DUF2235 family)
VSGFGAPSLGLLTSHRKILSRADIGIRHHGRPKGVSPDEAKQFQDVFSRPCLIHFAGLWDTVSSVGWVTEPVRLPNTARYRTIANVRHAQSIDERRIFFRHNSFPRVMTGDDLSDGTPSLITQDFQTSLVRGRAL